MVCTVLGQGGRVTGSTKWQKIAWYLIFKKEKSEDNHEEDSYCGQKTGDDQGFRVEPDKLAQHLLAGHPLYLRVGSVGCPRCCRGLHSLQVGAVKRVVRYVVMSSSTGQRAARLVTEHCSKKCYQTGSRFSGMAYKVRDYKLSNIFSCAATL